MASTPRIPATEFDRALQRRAHLRGKGMYNLDFPKDVFDPMVVGSTCRFICYPRKSMRLWPKKSDDGPTVVVFLLFPDLDLKKLRCGLQLTPIPDAIAEDDPFYITPLEIPVIPGIAGFLKPLENQDRVPAGWKRLVASWPGFVTGQLDPVQDLKAKLGCDHFLRVSFAYDDKGVAFAQNGPTFKIHNEDRSTEVKPDWTGMISDARDLGWFNFVNFKRIETQATKKRIWLNYLKTLPGIEPPESFHDLPVPANSLVGGSEGVDIKRPPYLVADEFDDPRDEPVPDENMFNWIADMGAINDEDRRGVDSPATVPSECWDGDGNSPRVEDSISNHDSPEEE